MSTRLCSVIVFLLLLTSLPALRLDPPPAAAQKAGVPAQGIEPAAPEATAATPEILISETSLNSFAIHNLRAYYSRHFYGDIGGRCTSQLWNADLTAGTSDKRVENEKCDGFMDIQLDNISIFYWNSQDGQIERRMRSDPTYMVVLASFDGATAVYGATPAGGGASVFWVTDTDPPRVESYDCNIPGETACIHKDLYTEAPAGALIGTVIASAEDVYWTELETVGEVRLELNKVPRDSSAPAGTVVYPVEPAGNDYDQLFVDDVSLYFNHQGISRIGLDETLIVWDYMVDAIELSQGTQTLDHDVGLVAGMPAVVRVYARQLQGPPETFVRDKLEASRGGVPLAGSPLHSYALWHRGRLDDSAPHQHSRRRVCAASGVDGRRGPDAYRHRRSRERLRSHAGLPRQHRLLCGEGAHMHRLDTGERARPALRTPL